MSVMTDDMSATVHWIVLAICSVIASSNEASAYKSDRGHTLLFLAEVDLELTGVAGRWCSGDDIRSSLSLLMSRFTAADCARILLLITVKHSTNKIRLRAPGALKNLGLFCECFLFRPVCF